MNMEIQYKGSTIMSIARTIGSIICGLMVLLCGWFGLLGYGSIERYREVQRYHAVQFPVDLSLRQTYSGVFHSRYYGFADQLRFELDPPFQSESEMEAILVPIRLRLRIRQADGYDCFDQVFESKHFNDEGIARTSSGTEETLSGCESTYGLESLTPYFNVIVPGPVPSDYTLYLEVLDPSTGLNGRKQMLSCYTVYCMTEVGLGLFMGWGICIVGITGFSGFLWGLILLLIAGRRRREYLQAKIGELEPTISSQTDTGTRTDAKSGPG
jgi:hypothetical protein